MLNEGDLRMSIIAVEDGLSDVQSALRAAGFEVTGMEPEEIARAHAVVVSGVDINILNRQDLKTRVPVINAVARTAGEVVSDLKERLQ